MKLPSIIKMNMTYFIKSKRRKPPTWLGIQTYVPVHLVSCKYRVTVFDKHTAMRREESILLAITIYRDKKLQTFTVLPNASLGIVQYHVMGFVLTSYY